MYSICFAITIFVVNKDCARVIQMNMTDCRKIWLLPAALTGLLPTCLVVRVVRSSHRVCACVCTKLLERNNFRPTSTLRSKKISHQTHGGNWVKSSPIFKILSLSPVYTIQPVVKPVVKPDWQPVVSCKQTFNRLSNPFDNRFDNRLYRVYSRLSNRLYNPVWQPVERTVAVGSTRLSNRSTSLTAGCIV